MLLSQDFKDFALYICPVLTMIGIIVTLIVTIHINKELLMGVKEIQHHGGSGDVTVLK